MSEFFHEHFPHSCSGSSWIWSLSIRHSGWNSRVSIQAITFTHAYILIHISIIMNKCLSLGWNPWRCQQKQNPLATLIWYLDRYISLLTVMNSTAFSFPSMWMCGPKLLEGECAYGSDIIAMRISQQAILVITVDTLEEPEVHYFVNKVSFCASQAICSNGTVSKSEWVT